MNLFIKKHTRELYTTVFAIEAIITQTWNQFRNTHKGQDQVCSGVLYNREMSELELHVLTQNKVQQ